MRASYYLSLASKVTLTFCFANACQAFAQIFPNAPAENPPFSSALQSAASLDVQLQAVGDPTLYDCGNPTDLEQQCLELINRARANPQAEALRLAFPTDPSVLASYKFYNVDTNLLVTQFASITPAQPLAFNAILMAAGRQHSQWMLVNDVQSHAEGALLTDQRFINAGYPWNKGGSFGENIFAYTLSVPYAHVAFNTDWGNGIGGMQTPPGHRNSIHKDIFREAGIGLIFGSNTNVGPQLITEEFGFLQATRPFVTGVAYYDLNGNQFYDPGEGIQGVRVDLEGSDRYAVTTSSGAYAVPYSGSGARRVQFSGAGFLTSTQSVTLVGGQNSKVDFTPFYPQTVIAGPRVLAISKAGSFYGSRVDGATSYELRAVGLTPFTDVEGAENGVSNVLTEIGNYPLIVSDVKAHGTSAFHLVQPTPPRPQSLQIARSFFPRAESRLSFSSRLGWASSSQVARAQVTGDDGAHWQDLWSRTGTGDKGQTAFEVVNVSLSGFAGQEIKVRFLYDFIGGTYFPQTDKDVGYYLDDVALTGLDQVSQPRTNSVPATGQFDFTATALGRYRLQLRPILPNHPLPWGPLFEVSSSNALASVALKLLTPRFTDATHWEVPVQILSGAPTFLSLESSSTPLSGWEYQSTATVESLGGGGYRIVVAEPQSGSRFFRVRAQ